MRVKLFVSFASLLLLMCVACSSQSKNYENVTVLMETDKGNIKVKLYDETPQHRDNFCKLVDKGFYDGVLFHRVIKDFMVQTGDPDSKKADSSKHLGAGGPGYTIPAEILYPKYYHKKGALCAARMGDQMNPEKRSSGSQFYIVTGHLYNEDGLDQMEMGYIRRKQEEIFGAMVRQNRERIVEMSNRQDSLGLKALQDSLIEVTEKQLPSFEFTPEIRHDYTTVGGTPHLDGEYTVFGEIIEGIEIIDEVQTVATNEMDRPLKDIRINRMKIVNE